MGGRLALAYSDPVPVHLQENIVAFYGSFIKNVKPNQVMWIVMEYCGGGSVSDIYSRLPPAAPLTEPEIAHIMYYSNKVWGADSTVSLRCFSREPNSPSFLHLGS